jgi:hypothetical protein
VLDPKVKNINRHPEVATQRPSKDAATDGLSPFEARAKRAGTSG